MKVICGFLHFSVKPVFVKGKSYYSWAFPVPLPSYEA